VSNSYTGIMPYDAIQQAAAISAAPIPQAAKKTALRRLYESALAQDAKAAITSPTGHSFVATARGIGGGAGVGLLLGWVAGSRQKGLDTPLGPLDAYVAGLGAVGSVIPGNPLAEDCRNASVAASAILAFRRMEAKRRAESGTPAAVSGEHVPDDPTDHIVQIAKKLGIDV
jgi:hypothetical protein